jgi:3-hydroxyacyl-[acyl-carrier-protein] dehydratase
MTHRLASDSVADAADVLQVMRILPHRYPMLMVDRVVEIEPDVKAVGIKNVTINEPQFEGHFPGRPIMPGVMLVEAMAQTAAVLVARSDLSLVPENKIVYLMSIETARFRKPVTPGDVLVVHVAKKRRRGNAWKFDGRCTVDGQVVAEATFGAMAADG